MAREAVLTPAAPLPTRACILDFTLLSPWASTLMVHPSPIFCILYASRAELFSGNQIAERFPALAAFQALAEESFI